MLLAACRPTAVPAMGPPWLNLCEPRLECGVGRRLRGRIQRDEYIVSGLCGGGFRGCGRMRVQTCVIGRVLPLDRVGRVEHGDVQHGVVPRNEWIWPAGMLACNNWFHSTMTSELSLVAQAGAVVRPMAAPAIQAARTFLFMRFSQRCW